MKIDLFLAIFPQINRIGKLTKLLNERSVETMIALRETEMGQAMEDDDMEDDVNEQKQNMLCKNKIF